MPLYFEPKCRKVLKFPHEKAPPHLTLVETFYRYQDFYISLTYSSNICNTKPSAYKNLIQ